MSQAQPHPNSRPAALATAAFGRGASPSAKSPTRSPSKASPARIGGASTLLRHSVDDVAYRHADSSARATDQARGGGQGVDADDADLQPQPQQLGDALPSSDKQSKYMHLLSAVYHQPAGSSKPRSPAASAHHLHATDAAAASSSSSTAATAPTRSRVHAGVAPLTEVSPPAAAAPPLRASSSPKGASAAAAGASSSKSGSTPTLRRSIRASILDSSQGGSLIPASPESAASVAAAPAGPHSMRPQHARATSPTVAGRLRSNAGASSGVGGSRTMAHHQPKEPVSPVRRSAPGATATAAGGGGAAQHRPQYAFGTRIEPPAAAKRRPSPTRIGPSAAGGVGASGVGGRIGRTAASPQRVPSAARASAAGAGGGSSAAGSSQQVFRSASAPRMSSAEKAQSRFTQHTLSAAAAQRSKTPNPAERAAAAAAAAASSSSGSGINAARRLRHSAHSASAAAASESRHVTRMRASETALSGTTGQHSRLPGFSSTMSGLRSPAKAPSSSAINAASNAPILRAGSRSVLASAGAGGLPAAARPSSAGRGIPGAPAGGSAGSAYGRVKPAGVGAGAGSRVGLSSPGGACSAAASRSQQQDSVPGVMVAVIKDRYKDLYKHTPAALAVQEAMGSAATAAAAVPAAPPSAQHPHPEHSRPRGMAAVPKLSLGGLERQLSGETLAAPRAGHGADHPQHQQQHQQQLHDNDDGADNTGSSPYLGRMSAGVAAGPAAEASAPVGSSSSYSTPPPAQRKPVVPLLALSTITPVPKVRPAGAAGVSDIDLTPCPTAAPQQDETPSLLVKSQPRTGSSSKATHSGSRAGAFGGAVGADAADDSGSPQLAPRNLMGGDSSSQAGTPEQQQQQQQDAAGAGAAARGLGLPSLQLQLQGVAGAATDGGGGGGLFNSPPRHRRGEPESPSVAAADSSHQRMLKNKVSSSSGGAHAAAVAARFGVNSTSAGAHAASHATGAGRSSIGVSKSSSGVTPPAAGKPRPRVGPGSAAAAAAAGGSVLEAADSHHHHHHGRSKVGGGTPIQRRSLGAPSPTASSAGRSAERGAGRSLRLTPADAAATTPSHGKQTPLPSPSKKLGTPVPRLDLTPVLATLASEQQQDSAASPSSGAHNHQGHHPLLLLEDAPKPRRLELDGDAGEGGCGDDDYDDFEAQFGQHREGAKGSCAGGGAKGGGHKGAPGSSGRGRGSAGKPKKGAAAAAPGSRGSQASAEPPPPESFYVYESVMPPEEQRTYEELRRVLQKAPGGSKHVANLQGIWGCYQDARRNTEAMAFRGHRLLDQVSTEYSSYKRESEVKLEELEAERDQAQQQLQLAMVAGSVPASALQLAAKDQQLRELQEENSLLRQQVNEMEKALQMASDYHSAAQVAHQEQQVPMHARVIAGSATTSILTTQVVAQQVELQKVEKRMEDMKAALHLACGVLRQTNYMEPHSKVREDLDADTVTVLDTIMATEEMEAEAAAAMHHQQQQHMMLHEGGGGGHMYDEAVQMQQPHVHIEEVHEDHDNEPAVDQ